MELHVSFKDAEEYLIARFEGKWPVDSVRDKVGDIAIEAEERGHTHILLDGRTVLAPITDFRRFLIGEEIAHAFRGQFKVAAVYSPELINKFAENTAVNRGASFIVLPTFDEAVSWLIG